jgi:hypothetical protein
MNGFDLYFLVAPKLVRTFFTSFVSVSLSSPFFLFFFVPAPVRLADVAEVGVAWFEADSFRNEVDRGVGAWEGVNCAGEGAGESALMLYEIEDREKTRLVSVIATLRLPPPGAVLEEPFV